MIVNSNLSGANVTFGDISNPVEISCVPFHKVKRYIVVNSESTSPATSTGKMVSLEEAFYTNNSFLGPNVDLEGEKNYQNNKL